MNGLSITPADHGGYVVGFQATFNGGDWITPETHAEGKFYPIKADVMAATYEEV